MDIKKQIQNWTEGGIISREQAAVMIQDISEKSGEERSNRVIVAISVIGAVLFGVGTILFLALNWDSIADWLKIVLLTLTTFGAYYAGFVLKYEKQNYPKVGASLIFLGALLFGVSIFLVAQIYNVNTGLINAYWLVLLWIIGILPLAYGFNSTPIACLAAALYFVDVALIIAYYGELYHTDDVAKSVIFYVLAAILLMGAGGVHYVSEKFTALGKIYRLAGARLGMFALFLLTFKAFYSKYNYAMEYTEKTVITNEGSMSGLLVVTIMALAILAISFWFNREKEEKITSQEDLVGGGLVLWLLLTAWALSQGSYLFFVFSFNLIFFGLSLVLIILGYKKENIKVVNLGTTWIVLFVITKYFEWLWDVFNPYIFFMVGGLLLIGGGIWLEKRRKELKEKINLQKNNG